MVYTLEKSEALAASCFVEAVVTVISTDHLQDKSILDLVATGTSCKNTSITTIALTMCAVTVALLPGNCEESAGMW